MVDCAINSSNKGTLDDPKFLPINLFENHRFPRIKVLGNLECKNEGYEVTIQSDNVGIYNETVYLKYVQLHCN